MRYYVYSLLIFIPLSSLLFLGCSSEASEPTTEELRSKTEEDRSSEETTIQREDESPASTEQTLMLSAALVEKSHRIDELALEAQATRVASRAELRGAMVAEYEGDVDQRKMQRHAEVHRYLNRDRLYFLHMAEQNVDERNLDLSLMERRPLEHDLFLALDHGGKLIAARGSRQVQMRTGDDFGESFSAIAEVLEEGTGQVDFWTWSWRGDAGEENLYLVVITPIYEPESDTPVGVVVLGHRLDDERATSHQELVERNLAGGDAEPGSESVDITYFHGTEIYGSTLKGDERTRLGSNVLDGRDLFAFKGRTGIVTHAEGEEYTVGIRVLDGDDSESPSTGIVLVGSE